MYTNMYFFFTSFIEKNMPVYLILNGVKKIQIFIIVVEME